MSTRYTSKKPCERCGGFERYSCNRNCCQCRLDYLNQWRKNNKDKAESSARKNRKIFYIRHKDKIKEENKKWDANNREKISEARKKRYKEDGGKRREKNKEYRNNNISTCRSYEEKYRKNNPEKYRASRSLHGQLLRKRKPKWFDLKKAADVYKMASLMTKSTGVKHHVDHIIPLRGKNVSGLHVHYNLQVITAIDNLRKGNRI